MAILSRGIKLFIFISIVLFLFCHSASKSEVICTALYPRLRSNRLVLLSNEVTLYRCYVLHLTKTCEPINYIKGKAKPWSFIQKQNMASKGFILLYLAALLTTLWGGPLPLPDGKTGFCLVFKRPLIFHKCIKPSFFHFRESWISIFTLLT